MKNLIYLILLIANLSFAQTGKFNQLVHKCKDDVERPFIVYTPNTIDAKSERPLLIYLHGSISNPNLKKDPLAYIKKSKLIDLANKGNFHLMFAFGQKGASWFDSIGIDMVMKEIHEVKDKLNINEDKVFLSGFSDGGSGALYFSLIQPSQFAGFIAMNGSLKVISKLSSNVFLSNSNNKPLYIINTKDDMLYDIEQIKPTIDYLKKFNNNITFKEVDGNHEMSYLKNQVISNDILSFIENTNRKPYKKISWESSIANKNSINGITIKEIDSLQKRQNWHQPYQLKVFNNKANFGIKYDYSYQGKGLKVAGFASDSVSAKRMGIQKGDIVLMMENDSIKNAYSPYFYIHKKKAEDATNITIKRNGKIKLIKGKFNSGYSYEVFNNELSDSGKFIATFTKNKLSLITSKISKLEIDFNQLKDYNIMKLEINNKKIKSEFKGIQIIEIE